MSYKFLFHVTKGTKSESTRIINLDDNHHENLSFAFLVEFGQDLALVKVGDTTLCYVSLNEFMKFVDPNHCIYKYIVVALS